MMHEFSALCGQVKDLSFDGTARRYYRFRHSSHDDAIVADCVGSNLRCAHDWGWCEEILDDPRAGRFYSPEDVLEEVRQQAADQDIGAVRFTGMEPIMADEHLLQTIELMDDHGLDVRIDTNGMLLDRTYLRQLDERCSLSIRLSFKGHDPDSFAKLTRIHPSWFFNQIRACRACHDADIDMKTVLAGVFTEQDRDELENWLPDRIDPELEHLRLCPENQKRLEEAGFDLDHVLG